MILPATERPMSIPAPLPDDCNNICATVGSLARLTTGSLIYKPRLSEKSRSDRCTAGAGHARRVYDLAIFISDGDYIGLWQPFRELDQIGERILAGAQAAKLLRRLAPR